MCSHIHKQSVNVEGEPKACQKASFLISKSSDTKLKVGERIALFIHLLMCKACKLFKIQSELLDNELKKLGSKDLKEPVFTLSATSKEQFKVLIEEELKKDT